MIYPSISELTKNKKINRYALVVATAKCARIITDEYVKQREYAEKVALSKDNEKKSTIANLIKREYRDEKAVKNAITGLYSGEFEIIEPDGSIEMINGSKPEEKSAEQTVNEECEAAQAQAASVPDEEASAETEETEEAETSAEESEAEEQQ